MWNEADCGEARDFMYVPRQQGPFGGKIQATDLIWSLSTLAAALRGRHGFIPLEEQKTVSGKSLTDYSSRQNSCCLLGAFT